VFVTMRAAQLPGLQVRARVPGLLFGSYCRRPKTTARSSRIVGQRMLPTSSRICTSMPSLHTSRGHTVVPPRRVDVSARPQLARGGHRLSLRVPGPGLGRWPQQPAEDEVLRLGLCRIDLERARLGNDD
ncbi:MAG: hypothetical protein ACK56F_01285, partial [bacterium]